MRRRKHVSRPISKLELRFKRVLEPLGFKSNIEIGEYRVDWVNTSSKYIVEVHGGYWHMDPRRFHSSDVNPTTKRTAADQWSLDAIRKDRLEARGYRVVVVWEREIGRKRAKAKLQELLLKKLLSEPAVS